MARCTTDLSKISWEYKRYPRAFLQRILGDENTTVGKRITDDAQSHYVNVWLSRICL